jgi:DNA-binding transcriptional ArsR family regulator
VWDREVGAFREPGPDTAPSSSTVPAAGSGPFLRGPVPMSWLHAAARLPGSALAVGVALWHLAGMRGGRGDLTLSSERLAPFGVSRHAKDRALRQLAQAGLVTVSRKRGRSPRVTLVGAGTSRRTGRART